MQGRRLVAALAGALLASSAWAQDAYVYPNAGQSQEQQQLDQQQCYQFAKQNTGFDPMAMPTTSAPPPPQDNRSAGGTALRGAGLGAVVGAIADGSDGAKKGAAIGGASGLLFGGARANQNQKQQQQWEQQQQQQYLNNRNNYNRAFAACMEGRNYTVR
jgi:hypothetical protein